MHKDRVHMFGKIVFSQDKTHLVVRMALFYIFADLFCVWPNRAQLPVCLLWPSVY